MLTFITHFEKNKILRATKLFLLLTRIDFAAGVSGRAVRVFPVTSTRNGPHSTDLFSYDFPKKLRAGLYVPYDIFSSFFSEFQIMRFKATLVTLGQRQFLKLSCSALHIHKHHGRKRSQESQESVINNASPSFTLNGSETGRHDFHTENNLVLLLAFNVVLVFNTSSENFYSLCTYSLFLT